MSIYQIIVILFFLIDFNLLISQVDSTKILAATTNLSLLTNSINETGLFKVFTGGISTIHHNAQNSAGVDLSVQTYHYFLITNKRFHNDSIHQSMCSQNKFKPKQLYSGLDFYILSRASLELDTLKSIANDYLTSLLASPFTIRVSKEIFLSKKKAITETDYTPVISLNLINDLRAVPFNDPLGLIQIGVSSHFYLSILTQFKRMEFDKNGNEIDKGTMYFQPSIGLAAGSQLLFESVMRKPNEKILISTECKLGFISDNNSVKDFAFLVRYTISDVIGPKLRAGVLLSAFK